MAPTSEILPMTSGPTAPPLLQASAAGFNWARCWILFILCVAVLGAVRKSWICDDAFLSFRYAENLVQHKALVFNAGERTEGFTNPAWTLWIAFGMLLRFDPEKWSIAWGIFFFAANVALLTRYPALLKALGIGASAIPVAALLAALHHDWLIYASSGLETSVFTFLLTAAYFIAAGPQPSRARLLLTGATLGVAEWVRPEGLLFAASMGLFLAIRTRGSIRAVLTFLLPVALMAGALFYCRVLYYNEFLPNTYYAKSADIPWYSQGLYYIGKYFERYWCLLVWIPLMPWILRGCSGRPITDRCRAICYHLFLLLLMILPYTFYLWRVGGDFMFARMLIPITPFFMLLVELAVISVFRTSLGQAAALSVVTLALLFTPASIPEFLPVHGVIDERVYYTNVLKDWGGSSRRTAQTLRKYFDHLPARIGFFGGQARLIYYSGVPYATECETGLTDYFIARQPLAERARVGHEKHAPILYLLQQNRLQFVFDHPTPYSWNRYIPYVEITLDSVRGRILQWDPAILGVLKQRGAVFPDFPALLDAYIEKMAGMPDEDVRRDYRKFRTFYFTRVHDPQREAKFIVRLRPPAVERP